MRAKAWTFTSVSDFTLIEINLCKTIRWNVILTHTLIRPYALFLLIFVLWQNSHLHEVTNCELGLLLSIYGSLTVVFSSPDIWLVLRFSHGPSHRALMSARSPAHFLSTLLPVSEPLMPSSELRLKQDFRQLNCGCCSTGNALWTLVGHLASSRLWESAFSWNGA